MPIHPSDIGVCLAHAFECCGMGIAVSRSDEPTAPIVTCNKAFAALFGMSTQEIVGRPHPLLSGPLANKELVERLTRARPGGASERIIAAFRRPDGIQSWTALWASTTEDPALGRVRVWVHQDATPQVAAQEMWWRYESIVNTAGEFMGLIDEEHRVEQVNSAYARAFGKTREAMRGLHLSDLFGATHYADAIAPLLRDCFSGREVADAGWGEFPAMGRRYVQARLYPYADADGCVRHVIFVVLDLTERKRAEDEVVALNHELEQRVVQRTEELRQLLHDMEAFSYSVAHDLKTPLALMRSFAGIVVSESGERLPPRSRRFLDLIIEGIDQMTRMISGLLTFAQTGRRALKRERVDMTALAQDVFDELRTVRDAPHAVARFEPTPPADADPTLARQVLRNLLDNALKYSHDRDPIQIEFGASIEGEVAVYYVRDNGVGFEAEQAEEAFRVFRRLRLDDDSEGTGVGLAIARRIVERHGGRIWCTAEPDVGACFYFTLRPETLTEAATTTQSGTDDEHATDPAG